MWRKWVTQNIVDSYEAFYDWQIQNEQKLRQLNENDTIISSQNNIWQTFNSFVGPVADSIGD